tara:strand:- start:221 stop:412 length:192 start_codon:yes stop_codon:yes gene_type:complete
MKRFYWKIETDGFLDAESLDEARNYIALNGSGLVLDDEPYWTVELEDVSLDSDQMFIENDEEE